MNNSGQQVNPLLNKALALDTTMMMNILIELLNCKPITCIHLPDFRIDQLLKYVAKRISPVSEKKILEPICALYCLCMYFGMTTSYMKSHAFRFFALVQTLQAESIVTLTNITHKKIQMPDIFLALRKDDSIDINHKLEVFTDALAVAKLMCRELYSMMKVVFRVGRRGAPSASFTPDEKKKQAKYSECVQPYSLYFMCTFAYSHMAVVLQAAHNINIYPGTLECFMLMTMTTTPVVCSAMQEKGNTNTASSPSAIIQATTAQLEASKIGEGKDGAESADGSAKPVAVVVALKLSYEVILECAHKLAVFVAHVICDDRNLQEVRLAQGRLCKNFKHPDVTFAQFRTSGLKALLAQEHHSPHASHVIASATTGAITNTPSGGNAATLIATSATGSPKKKNKPSESTAVMEARGTATKQGIVDIYQEGIHFLRHASGAEDWQLNDPSEQDFDYNTNTNSSSTAATTNNSKSKTGFSGNSKYSSKLTAEKLAATGVKTTLPALQLSKGRAKTPTGRAGGSETPSKRAVEGISELPLQSGRVMAAREAGNRQRSARSGGQRSSRSRSSDGEGGASDSDTASNVDDVPTVASYSTKGNFSSMQSNKYNNKRPKSSGPEDLFVNMDQKIAGYWAMGKIFRAAFVVLDSLQSFPEYAHYFAEEYKPEPVDIAADQDLTRMQPALNTRVVHEACKAIESQYFHLSASIRLPRILDPTQNAYWFCTYLLDYLARQTTNGQGLHPSTAMELNVLKKRFKSMKLEHASGTRDNISPTKARPSAGDMGTQITPSNRATLRLPEIPTPTQSTQTKKREKTFISIQDRLAAAAVEASVESRLFSMERKLKAELAPPPAESPTRFRFLSEFSDNDQSPPGDTERPRSQHHHRHKEATEGPAPSVVWTCPARQNYLRTAMFTGQDDDEMNENPFKDPISKAASVEYAKKILAAKREKEEEEAQFKQYLADQQEGVIARNRAAKAEMIRQLREQTKTELLNKAKFKAEWEVLQRKQFQMDKARAKQEAKEREDKKLMEIIRIKDIKAMHANRIRQAEIEHKEAIQLEAAKIQMMASDAEVQLINRMNREEARMKYLEERRRAIEDKVVQAEVVKKTRLARRQEKAADIRDHFQARVRMGNFKYHNGEYGFYDSVRAAPVEWVQYEDAQGVPYYYDPISKLSQYRVPVDANIHHYTEDERREYDAVHGDGAYDAYKADCAFKDGVNRDGGYYNAKGVWIVMDGYFDENYEWVANEGYYDENGKYRKYAKVCGDLSFMV